MELKVKAVSIRPAAGVNIVVGQSHFIRTIEDLAEAVTVSVPQARFGAAFNEASGPCLVRVEGNDAELKTRAAEHALAIGAGHVFVLLLRDCYPINVLSRIKDTVEVCSVFCATANPLEVIVAESDLGRGVLGVIDGERPRGIEGASDVEERKGFLRRIGYKL